MPYKLKDIMDVLSEETLENLFNEYEFYSEGKFDDSVVNAVDKAAHTKAGKKVIKTVDNLKNKPKNENIEKAVSTVKAKTGEIVNKVSSSKAVEKTGNAVNTAVNKTSEVLGKAIAGKRPTDKSSEVQEKYENKVNNARAAIKGGVVLASKAVLIGPLDWLLTASIVKGIAESDDPSDKMIKNKFQEVSDKTKVLKDRLVNVIDDAKKEDKPAEEIKKQYDTIALQGLNYAKQLDAVRSKLVQKEHQVIESVVPSYTFDKYLIKEDGSMVDNAYELLSMIVEKVDYEKYDVYEIIEDYINMLM
jgi:hypothetical protein